MKKLIPTNLRELRSAKRPYQILTYAVITAVVFTAIPSFAAPLPDAVPAKEVSLNYVSPLMKAIELENQLERSELSPVEVAMPTQAAVEPRRCINGRVSFNSENLTNGFTFSYHPGLIFTLGKVKGSITAWGRYCGGGTWSAGGQGAVTIQNEVFAGLRLQHTWWEFYLPGGRYRFQFECGIKGEGNMGANADFHFAASNQSREEAYMGFAGRGDLIVSFVAPKLTIQKWVWSGSTGSHIWFDLPIHAPTNGQYINGISFEASAFGALTAIASYQWTGTDNDPDRRQDHELQRFYGSLTGSAGVNLKFKNRRGQEYSVQLAYQHALGGFRFDSAYQRQPVSDATDVELDKRPY